MTRRWPCITAAMLCCLFALATSSHAECAWVLWEMVKFPSGPTVTVPAVARESRAECEEKREQALARWDERRTKGRGPRGGRAVPEGVHVDLYEAAGRVRSCGVSLLSGGFTSSRLRHGAVDSGLARFRQPCIRARQGRGMLAGA